MVDALAKQSDCSSASNGVAAARTRRIEYVDRMLLDMLVWIFEGFVDLFVGFAENGGWWFDLI